VQTDLCFAVCAPGLEPLAMTELAGLGLSGREEPGGVLFDADPAALCRANLHLRTVTRVLLRLGTFRARTFAELERHARALPWDRLLEQGMQYRLRVSCAKSKLYHEGAVAQRLHGVIDARTGADLATRTLAEGEEPTLAAGESGSDLQGEDPEAQAADVQLFVVRFFRDVCTVSADTSGAPLYMRGYRQELARAPLRETLAAAMLLASGWPGNELLVDPFCGSGTIPIEGALLARRIAPGLASPERSPRQYRFQSWPEHSTEAWSACVARAREAVLARAAGPIHGFDRDPGAIRAARANAARAGVEGDVEFREQEFERFEPAAGSGWLVTNPPYGIRVGGRRESQQLLAKLGSAAGSSMAAWTVSALAPPDALRRALGGGAKEVFRTRTGGIAVSFVVRKGRAEARAADGGTR
jgi:putative N6-adenine-specific DNA methylase